jgi:putative NADH-flavin reductase
MVGQGVLRECLLDPDVESVLAVVRNASLPQHDKLREIVHQDIFELAAIEDRLSGYDACFFCLGVPSVGMKEETYRRVTYDLTVSVAKTLAKLNPTMTFIYVSGAGTDSTERGRLMWARVAARSLALSGLMSGASNISCSCSMSSIMRSTSIPSQYPT